MNYTINHIIVVKSERLQWVGHIRRQKDHIIRLVWEEIANGKRPLGQPRMRWKDNFKTDMRILKIDCVDDIIWIGLNRGKL